MQLSTLQMRKLRLSVDDNRLSDSNTTKNLSWTQQNSTLKTVDQNQPIKWVATSIFKKQQNRKYQRLFVL